MGESGGEKIHYGIHYFSSETAMLLVQQTLFAKPFVVPLPIPGKVFGGGGELVFTDDNYLIVGGDFFGGDFDFEV